MIKKIIKFLWGKRSESMVVEGTIDNELQPRIGKAPMLVSDNKDVGGQANANPRRIAKEYLAQYGIGAIRSQDDINRIFWEMAVRRLPISKQMTNAIRILICDNRQMKSFNRKLEFYNKFLDSKFSDPEFRDERQKLKDMEKFYKAEILKLSQAKARVEKEKNVIKQKLQEVESANRKVSKKFMGQLKTYQGRFLSTYDFTSEKDITEYLSWYRFLKQPVSKRTINSILKHQLSETDNGELFLRLVDEHNQLYAANYEDDMDESDGVE